MFRGLGYLAELALAAVFVIVVVKELLMPLMKGTELFPMFRGLNGNKKPDDGEKK